MPPSAPTAPAPAASAPAADGRPAPGLARGVVPASPGVVALVTALALAAPLLVAFAIRRRARREATRAGAPPRSTRP